MVYEYVNVGQPPRVFIKFVDDGRDRPKYVGDKLIKQGCDLGLCYKCLILTSPLFCKKGTTHNISILQDKQDVVFVLHVTNALRRGITPPPLFCYS
jgi:hypothetical protein